MRKRILTSAILSLALFAACTVQASGNGDDEKDDILAIGTKAPKAKYEMKDISGKSITLNDIAKENGLLVVFSCNTCPFVVGSDGNEGWEGRYNDIHDDAAAKGIGMVLVNSNEGKREGADSFDEMKEHADSKGYKSLYVMDNNSELADAFGAKTTPHVFLFDKDMKLVYKGAIDDNVKDSKDVKETYLNNALKNLSKGKEIDPASTRQKGCSIKRVKS